MTILPLTAHRAPRTFVSRFTFHVSRLLLGALLLAPTPALGQDSWDPSRVYASRGGLDSLARRFELAAESPAYSEVLRGEARGEAGSLRARLKDGDFRVGDRIVLVVEREQALTDTFTVEQGPAIQLPTVGRLSLAGVLRSEAEAHLKRELGRYIRDPVVRARTTIRITVTGEVGQPGFYGVPSEALVTDVLVLAGQVTPLADLGDIHIERANRIVWDNKDLGPEIIEGRTLDQLGVQAGDRLVVGTTPRPFSSFEGGFRTLLLIITVPAAIAGLVAIFN